MSKKSFSELFKRWSKWSRSGSAGSDLNRARLRLEEFEVRLVPATLPPVTVSDTRVIAAGAFAPQAVADPTNPNLIVVVSGSTQNQVGASLVGQITRDGGQTWSGFNIANPDTGTNAGPGGVQLTMVNTPSVTMSRTGDLYVVWTSTTADQTTADVAKAGRLRVASFTVQQTQPAIGNGVAVLNPSQMIYEWLNQDAAYNPTIAVNNNLDEYTDPDTATTTPQDTMLRDDDSGKAVYIAWNTNAVTPTVIGHTLQVPTQFTPTAIFAAASRDRGRTWTTPVTVNDGGHFVQGGGVAPQIKFTPDDLNPDTQDNSGRLQIIWTTPGGASVQDVSRPDGGNIGQEVSTVYVSPVGAGGFISEAGIDPNGGAHFPVTTKYDINVNIDNSATSTNGAFFDFLSDLDVEIALVHPHVNQLSVTLTPPAAVGGAITLVLNRMQSDGNPAPALGTAPRGLPDNNDTSGNSGIGVTNQGAGATASGTIFSSEAARLIHDPANVAGPRTATGGYIASYRPELGTLGAYYGSSVSDLNGTWTLRITDFRDDDGNAGPTPGVPQNLVFWQMRMSSLIVQEMGGDSLNFNTGVGPGANLGGAGGSNATATGFSSGASYAYDLSQGAFSPYSGRLYAAYTNGDIQVRYSDDNGDTWSFPTRVNDDFASDNFSEGGRTQLQPSVAVDPVTGTVVVTWYDARWDASNARVATYIATSIDGGDTWSVQDRTAFLNNTKDATDQLNRNVIVQEPVPTNLRAIGTREAGQRQSLIANGGQIKAFWTGNENAGGAGVYTATVRTSAGPRIVDNDTQLNTDQGAVTLDAPGGYNDTFTLDGTRRIDGFTVTFDRFVDVSTFNAADVTVLFRAPGTDRTVAATRIPVLEPVPLDPETTQFGFPDDATRFFIPFATPQTAVGTYSYAVGPNVSDRVRSQRVSVFTPSDTPNAIPDLEMVESTISVPVLEGNPVVENMQVKLDIAHSFVGDLRITLFGPDLDGDGPAPPLSIVLSDRNGGAGSNYTNTRFNDAAVSPITAGAPFASAPFNGTFRPEDPLATFIGLPLAGSWTLRVENVEGLIDGTLLGWSITFLDGAGNPITLNQSRTLMDQDGDARTNEIGTNFNNSLPKNQQAPRLYTDAYTAPGSSGRDQFNIEPFAGPIAENTLPLISAGPRLVLVGNPGETAVVSFATRDATDTNVLHVTLDRAVDVKTFDVSDIVSVVNAGNSVGGTFTIVPTNEANEIASEFDFEYAAALPSGKYSVTLSPTFLVADGMFRNTTSNQMLVRFDRDIDPSTFTPANVLRVTGPIGDIQDFQEITVLGTAGTFTVSFNNGGGVLTTAALPFDIPATGGTTATSSVQNAIAALASVGVGNVTVSERPTTGGRIFTIVFGGGLRSNQPIMTAAGAGGATASVFKALSVTPLSVVPATITQGGTAAPEVQTIRVVGDNNTFTLTFNGSTTTPLSTGATASQVQAALNALTSISTGGGSVVVTEKGTRATSNAEITDLTYTITFAGALGGTNVSQITGTYNGGARSFIVTYAQQRLSGPYIIEFGQDPFGNSVRAVDVPQLVQIVSTPTNTIDVTFNRVIAANGVTAANLLQLTGPSGLVNLAGMANAVRTATTATTSTFRFTLPAAIPAGQYVLDFDPNPTLNLRVENTGPAIDMNFNAGLDTLRGDDPTSSDLDPLAYPSTGAVAIPAGPGGLDPVVTESYIVIDEDYIIRQSSLEQIRLRLNLSHPDVRDLTIDLVPPDATGLDPIRLFTGGLSTNTNIVASANFIDTLLVDRVGDPNVTNIQAGTPPFLSGSSFYSPQTPLSGLVGKSAKGVWTLRVMNFGTNAQTNDPNFTTGDPIEITNWTLTLPRALTIQTQRFDRTSAVVLAPGTSSGGPVTPVVTNSTLFVPTDFQITETTLNQIQMAMNITHPNVRDLDIDLVAPDNTTIRVFTGSTLAPTNPNQTANFTNTRLVNRVNDASAPSIQTAIPPFNAGEAGFFSPQNSLNSLIGKSTFGTWTLRVTNRGTNPPTIDPNFDATGPVQISNWSLTFPREVATTGLGQATADRFQAAFRIFVQDPTNNLTQTTWTPVGPAPTNETANAARISAMAVDPTDPTGNTVYVAVAGGGIWKTTDFLNSSFALQNGGLVPRGPSYVPLTDFGPTSAVNVSSIAVFPRNNDPHQTIILALTGEPAVENDLAGPLTQAGVGVIRSLDGGRTWQVLDSVVNVDSTGAVLPMADQNTRNHLFVGATGHKIIVDPSPGKDGGVIVYMALSGTAAQGGVWRSLNGGNTWTRMMAGNATDVALSAGSANPTDPASGKTVYNGNLQQLFAAFRSTPVATGPGVYKTDSAPAAASLNFMAGGTQNPLIRDVDILGSPEVTTATPASIPNTGRRTLLAVPARTGDPLKDSFLKDWVYALTTDGVGLAASVQLYMTKDAGAHWTRVRLPVSLFATNNEETNLALGGRAQLDVGSLGDYALAIAVDPENPYIVYLAGAGGNSIRVDVTKMRDAHNFTFYNNSNFIPTNAANPAFTTEVNGQRLTIGGLQPQIFQPPNSPVRGYVYIGGDPFEVYEDADGTSIGFLNLFGGRDYNQPFITNSLIRVGGTSDSIGGPAGFFVNDGADTSWNFFTDILDLNVPDQTGSNRTQNRFSAINTHSILSFTDPVTGKTRLIFGTDDGVFTGVDDGSPRDTGTLSQGIGFSSTVNGNRNGNLQVSQFYSGAVQPSQLAADLAGALFYGMGDQSGFPVSGGNILATGDLNWRGPTGHGASVFVDQAGSGTAFQYRSPTSSGFDLNSTATDLDFFRVFTNTALHSFGGGFSRTGDSSGSLFDQGESWPDTYAWDIPTSIPQPNANPANPNILIFGSPGGRVYRSTNQGVTWNLVASPGNLDGSDVLASAFGASDPALPTLTNNFLYAGTLNGNIYSTTTGGAPWTLIGSAANGLDGQDVIRIIPNPQVGKKDVFALTTSGVFYKADGTVGTGTWTPLNGNLFNLTRSIFGNDADQDPALRANSLTALAVDWRYAFPQPTVPGATFPILYVAGSGGVFRTVDFGTTWTFFPDVITDGAPADGGYLPNTHITDLDLSIGDLDPTTGRYKAGGLNMLVATTYGRGTFAIRLDTDLPASSFISGPRVVQLINPNPLNGPSTSLQVRFSGPVDPATFTPADVQIVGPNGPIPITSVNMISTTGADGSNPRNLFSITFPTQTGVGSYDIIIGYNPNGDTPQVSDPSGFLMNQDNDSTNGEAIVDQFRTTLQLNSNTNSRLVVTLYPATATAGASNTVTIEARDGNDVLLSGVSGTLTFTPAPGTGTFTPSSVALTNGVATFPVVFQTAGNQTVNATYTGLATINPTAWTTVVVAGAATQFSISPASSLLTAPANQTFTLTAQDAFGNTDLTYNRVVGLTRTGSAATLPATVTTVNGVATFNGVFNASGNVQITASGADPANLPNGTITGTANVVVSAGPAAQLDVDISAGPYAVGTVATVTVTALDSQGNVASTLDGTNLTINGSPAPGYTINPASPTFINGVATYTVTFTAAGFYTFTNIATGPIISTIGPIAVAAAPPPPSPAENLPSIYGVGSGVAGSTDVTIYNGNGNVIAQFTPFPGGFNNQVDPNGPGFLGGNRVAVGDVTGDGIPDYIVGSGPSIQASVIVVDGKTGTRVLDYRPFENFDGGVFVTTGDITGDGIDEIVMTPDVNGGPRVTVLRGGNFTRIHNFLGINDENFRGGARPAVGDINGDGFAELVVSAGFGGGPRISIYDGAALAQGKLLNPIGDFFLFEESLRNGAYVAVGDVDGDGFGDLIGGAGPGGGPRVFIVSGDKLLDAGPDGPQPALDAPIANFFAGDVSGRGGIRVAVKNIDGDRKAEVVTGSGGIDENGTLGGSRVTVYLGTDLAAKNYVAFDEFDYITGFYDGVFVG